MENARMEDDQEESEIPVSSTDCVCIFCDKSQKKFKNRHQQLHVCQTDENIENLKSEAREMGDMDIVFKIDEKLKKNEYIFYHRICKVTHANKLSSERKSDEKTPWHEIRNINKLAYDEVFKYVRENIIEKKKCVYLEYLRRLFVSIVSENQEHDRENIDVYNFERELLKAFPNREIKIIEFERKKIIKPYNGVLLDSDITKLDEEDILFQAALILRSKIRKIKKNIFEDNLSAKDLMNGECVIPDSITNFYVNLISGTSRSKRSENTKKLAYSFASDIIYNVTNANIRPSKHITLGIAIKSLTNSKKIINILNRYGHCCSYTVLEELETEATFTSSKQTDICPEDVHRSSNLKTGVAFNNFDRFVDTPTGKDTLHDTVGIIFQDIVETPDQGDNIENEASTSRNENSGQSIGKRLRRSFDAITVELQPYLKKPRVNESLLPITGQLPESDMSKSVRQINFVWLLSHICKIPFTPSWTGFNSLIHLDENLKQRVSYLTTINSSPTSKEVVQETLYQCLKIASECNQDYIEVTYDLGIAKIAYQIQSTERPTFDKVFIHIGSFHLIMAYFKACGKFIENCGITNILVNANVLAQGSVNSFIAGKHYNRCRRLYPLISLALNILHFKRFAEEEDITLSDHISDYLSLFIESKSAEPRINDEDLLDLYTTYNEFRERTLEGQHGKTAKFYMIFINLIDHYLILNYSIRTGNFDVYKNILPAITNMFFIFNQQNYSRYSVLYHNKLMAVEEPSLLSNLQSGSFGVKRTDKPFSKQPVDLTLEQTINADAANKLTGISHTTNSISARQRWCKSHSLRSKIISHVMEITALRKAQDITADLQKSRISLFSKQLQQLIDNFQQNLDPFNDNIDKAFLYNISSGQSVPENIEKFLLTVELAGNEQRDKFCRECEIEPMRFEKPIRKNKILTFANSVAKQKLKISGKLVEVKMQRDIFGQLLRISLEKTLDIDKVLSYPLTPIPLALCHADGIICKTNKSVLMKLLEKKITSDAPEHSDVIIFDGFFIIHSMTEVPSKFGNISQKLLHLFTRNNAKIVIITFDRYLFPSIKDNEHILRGAQIGREYNINGADQIRPSDFHAELRNINFKNALVKFLIDNWCSNHLAVHFMGKTVYVNHVDCYKYEVINGEVIRTNDTHLSCPSHEEADTKIIFHICNLNLDYIPQVTIRCSDTDIIIILLGNMGLVHDRMKISMHVGTGNNHRFIDVNKLYKELGQDLCNALPAFHAFTGCDFNPAFFKKGKQKPFNILEKSQIYKKAFTDMSENYDNLQEAFNVIEKFTCEVYGYKRITKINESRVASFMKKYKIMDTKDILRLDINFDASQLAPSQSELYEQFLRAVYISKLWKNSSKHVPMQLDATEYGWVKIEEKYCFKWFDGDQLPVSIESISIEDDTQGTIDVSYHPDFNFLMLSNIIFVLQNKPRMKMQISSRMLLMKRMRVLQTQMKN